MIDEELWRQQVVATGARIEAKVDALHEMFAIHIKEDDAAHERITFIERNYVSRTAFWTLLIAFCTFFAGGYASIAGWIHH